MVKKADAGADANADAPIADADKDENASGSYDGGDDTVAAGIDEDEDIDNRSNNAIPNGVDGNNGKWLKVIQSKLFMVVVNRKKSYSPKKILATKLL